MKKALFLLLLLSACRHAPFQEGNVLGADDLVIDSYALIEEPPSALGSIMVNGAVNKQGALALNEPFLPLRDVLLQAGGLSSAADKSHIYLIRNTRIYKVRFEHLVHLSPKSLLVLPGDIVYVSTKPLYRVLP